MYETIERTCRIHNLMIELTNDQLDLIDKYLLSEVNDTERAEIEALITRDPAWKEAYALRFAVRNAGKQAFHRNMRTKFKGVDSPGSSGARMSPVWLAIAAGVAILVSAVIWLFPAQGSDNLLAEYQSFPNVVLPIEKSGDALTNRELIYQSYELGKYDQAIALFSELDTFQTVDRLYFGLSYLESGNFDAANVLLDEVRASSNPRWSHVADWYQAWLLVKQDHLSDARVAFERIAKIPGHRYQADAQKMSDKLKD